MYRVALATYFEPHTGGLNTHMETLSNALSVMGIDNKLIFNRQLFVHEKALALIRSAAISDYVKVNVIKRKSRNLNGLVLAEANNFDLFHFQDPISLALTNVNKPSVLTVHGPTDREAIMSFPKYNRYHSFLRDLMQIAYKKADKIITVDTGQKNIITEEYNIDKDKIHVIFNSVDTDKFIPLKQNDSENYLIVPRRLVSKNGVAVAIEAMKHLKTEHVKLYIAGDGSEMRNLKNYVHSINLESRIVFLGEVNHNELLPLIQKSLAVIIPSVPVAGVVEATSIAALEGMACQKVVIASDIGGLSEIIKNGSTGLLFESGNAVQLANMVDNILLDIGMKSQIEQQARNYIESDHSLTTWTNKILKVYELVLDTNK